MCRLCFLTKETNNFLQICFWLYIRTTVVIPKNAEIHHFVSVQAGMTLFLFSVLRTFFHNLTKSSLNNVNNGFISTSSSNLVIYDFFQLPFLTSYFLKGCNFTFFILQLNKSIE